MPKSRAEKLELQAMSMSAEDIEAIDGRIDAVRRLHLEGVSLDELLEAVQAFGRDCYFQGLLDGRAVTLKPPPSGNTGEK